MVVFIEPGVIFNLLQGSLEDLLANDTVRLGWDFKYSLLKDICRGMDYLHRSALESHGRLKSTNCLVDNRWTCKIAGKWISNPCKTTNSLLTNALCWLGECQTTL